MPSTANGSHVPDEADRLVRDTLVVDLPPGVRVQAEMLAAVTTGVAP